jgi:hypothetical protein
VFLPGAPSGAPILTLIDAVDPTQRAIFDLPESAGWGGARSAASFEANVQVESNTIRGADLSAFDRGGTMAFETVGVTVDSRTNLLTVQEGATGSFLLRPVPEPATALLAMTAGAMGLAWLWHTRRTSRWATHEVQV